MIKPLEQSCSLQARDRSSSHVSFQWELLWDSRFSPDVSVLLHVYAHAHVRAYDHPPPPNVDALLHT